MRASSCDHCTRLSIARTLGVASVLDRLAPEIEREKAKPESLAQKYGRKFEDNLQNELIANMGEPGLIYGKVMYSLLCATLQYLVELGLISPNTNIGSNFS